MSFPKSHARRTSSSTGSDCSSHSNHTASTAPTIFSDRPTLRHCGTDISEWISDKRWSSYSSPTSYPTSPEPQSPIYSQERASELTYASTVPSEADYDEADYDEALAYDLYEEPEDFRHEDYEAAFEAAAIPATPPEFGEYFPSTRRLNIKHDDTIDGNMNLRVDTEIQRQSGRRVDLTLFHLRMHDLKNREFSLRRYCRDSGREVCHSSRKYAKPASERRPALTRSMSSALASLRPKSSDSKTSPQASLKRTDSGYDSMSEDEDEGWFEDDYESRSSGVGGYPSTANHFSAGGASSTKVNGSSPKDKPKSSLPVPTNTTNLSFSNYAHVELKRRGNKGSKRYEFEYWGTSYAWKRAIKKVGPGKDARETSYHLYANNSTKALAHVVPTPMTPFEAEDEEAKGGWIPPSSMWITDVKGLGGMTHVADVIIATGLMTLVDDTIKNRWHRKDRFRLAVPLPSISAKLNMEYVGPKRLIDEVFNRRSTDPARHSPLRQVSRDGP